MDEITEKPERPASITVICVVGFIGALFAVPLIFSPLARMIGSWYPPYLAFSCVVGFVCMVGLWKMKKWAVYIYTGFVLLNQIVLLSMGVWNVFALIIPAIVIVIAIKNLPKMS